MTGKGETRARSRENAVLLAVLMAVWLVACGAAGQPTLTVPAGAHAGAAFLLLVWPAFAEHQ